MLNSYLFLQEYLDFLFNSSEFILNVFMNVALLL